MTEETDAELSVLGKCFRCGTQAIEGCQACRVHAGGIKQVLIIEAELPDIDVEGHTVKTIIDDSTVPCTAKEPVTGKTNRCCEVGQVETAPASAKAATQIWSRVAMSGALPPWTAVKRRCWYSG